MTGMDGEKEPGKSSLDNDNNEYIKHFHVVNFGSNRKIIGQ